MVVEPAVQQAAAEAAVLVQQDQTVQRLLEALEALERHLASQGHQLFVLVVAGVVAK
jgi:ABC-type transporter Mla subunit MlaD